MVYCRVYSMFMGLPPLNRMYDKMHRVSPLCQPRFRSAVFHCYRNVRLLTRVQRNEVVSEGILGELGQRLAFRRSGEIRTAPCISKLLQVHPQHFQPPRRIQRCLHNDPARRSRRNMRRLQPHKRHHRPMGRMRAFQTSAPVSFPENNPYTFRNRAAAHTTPLSHGTEHFPEPPIRPTASPAVPHSADVRQAIASVPPALPAANHSDRNAPKRVHFSKIFISLLSRHFPPFTAIGLLTPVLSFSRKGDSHRAQFTYGYPVLQKSKYGG